MRGLAHPLECRPAGSDIHCRWQAFGLGDCDVELSQKPQVILDAGANVGYASVFYANRYPATRIIAVGPHRENASNVQHYPNVTLVPGGIWSRPVDLVIENPLDPSWAFRVSSLSLWVTPRRRENGVGSPADADTSLGRGAR